MALLPQIDNMLNNYINNTQIPSKTYKLHNDMTSITTANDQINIINCDRIIGYTDNIEAIKQAVYHILNTERYAYLIYDDNYGVELEQYIGKSFDYLETTIENTLKEALLQDLRILDVSVQGIDKTSNDCAKVNFTITSIYGDLQMEVNINV